MGSFVLKGITTALLVTFLTLLVGIVWSAMGFGGLSVPRLLDIGLLASCLIGGYRTAKESGVWVLGGATGAGYVTVGTLLLALFLPIRGLGFIQVLMEGVIIGLVSGAVGAGNQGAVLGARQGKRRNVHYSPYREYISDFDDQDNKFEWDGEDKTHIVENEPIKDWMDSVEGESQEIQGVKQDLAESQDVEWSWDREVPSKRESDPVWGDVNGGNLVIVNNPIESKEKKARPWWEE